MTMSKPVRQILAVAIFAVLCVASWSLILAPSLESISTDRSDIALSLASLTRYERIVAEQPALARQLDTLRASDDADLYVSTAPAALMAATMIEAVQGFVSASGAALRTSRTLAPLEEEGFQRVGVELEISTPLAGLKQLLYALAAAKPAIVVDRLAIQVPENGAVTEQAGFQFSVEASLTLLSYARDRAIVPAR